MTVVLLISILVIFIIVLLTNPVFTNKKNSPITVSKENLYNHVKFLTSIDPPRNAFNTESLEKSAEYIYENFKRYCEKTYYQTFKAENVEYKNVICEFGKGKELIVIGAHYDVCCDQPGADDNASGVAGLLELARLLAEKKPELKSRVQLVAYSLEEPPYFATEQMGSFIHARSLYEKNEKVKFMISLEMIGYFSEEKGSQKFPFPLLKLFYPDKGNFIGIVGRPLDWFVTRKIKKKIKSCSDIEVYSINTPNIIPGIDFSDHRNYWKFGYKAVMITDTAFYRNPNYHTQKDTVQTLNFDKMAQVVKGVYCTLLE